MAKRRVGIRNGALFNQTSTLWNNLLAYYKGDGTPADALGNYNGTLVNGATYGTGKISQGFSFDGVNDTVDFGNNLDFDGSTPFSISCWVNPNNVTSVQVPLAKAKNTIDYEGYWFLIIDGKMQFVLSSGINANDWVRVENSITLSTSTWYHCIMTYDGSKSASGLKVYVNNSLNTQNIIKDTLTGSISNTRSFKLGARDNGFLYNGIIDEVGVWDRELSESEVTELYNNGNGKQYTPPVVSTPSIITDGLVLNLDAGDTLSYPGTGTDWFDLTSNNNDGILVNGVSYLTDNGGVMSFDSINDYVSITNSPDLDLPINTTLEFWVKPSALNSNDLITHRWNCYGMGYNPTFTNGYVTSKFSVYFVISGWKSVSTTTTPLINSWYHIVGTYDGSTMKIYLNGVLENTRSIVGVISQNEADLGIGSYIGAPGTYSFDGEIPIGRIYHKTLTDSEVLQNYNATKGRFGL